MIMDGAIPECGHAAAAMRNKQGKAAMVALSSKTLSRVVTVTTPSGVRNSERITNPPPHWPVDACSTRINFLGRGSVK
jgi:hypothetical protein